VEEAGDRNRCKWLGLNLPILRLDSRFWAVLGHKLLKNHVKMGKKGQFTLKMEPIMTFLWSNWWCCVESGA
jgi:hypothetical protein